MSKASGTSVEDGNGGRGERFTEFQTSETTAGGEHVQTFVRNEVTGQIKKVGDHVVVPTKAA